MKKLLLTVVFLCFGLNVFAIENELTFRCKFTEGQFTNFDNGKPNSKRSEFPELVFDKINENKGTARIIGNNGAVDITAIAGGESVHLVEQTATGNLSIATIFTSKKFANVNAYPVVLSSYVIL